MQIWAEQYGAAGWKEQESGVLGLYEVDHSSSVIRETLGLHPRPMLKQADSDNAPLDLYSLE